MFSTVVFIMRSTASLKSRKIYEVIPDAQAKSRHYLRVMDESGEDYLYPEKLFLAVPLPENVCAALHQAQALGRRARRGQAGQSIHRR